MTEGSQSKGTVNIETSPLHFTGAELVIEALILNLIQLPMNFMYNMWLHLYHMEMHVSAPLTWQVLQPENLPSDLFGSQSPFFLAKLKFPLKRKPVFSNQFCFKGQKHICLCTVYCMQHSVLSCAHSKCTCSYGGIYIVKHTRKK